MPVDFRRRYRIGGLGSGVSNLFPPEAESQLRAVSRHCIERGYVTARVVSADKSLHRARGPLWHKKHRKRNVVPKKLRGVDRQSQWGYSPYHRWVQGYAQHTVVNATPGEARLPLDCTAAGANMAENQVFIQRVPLLPANVQKTLLDGSYDDEEVFRICKQYGIRPIVRMEVPRADACPLRLWAWKIRALPTNQALYVRRRTTIEPSFGNGKKSFENSRVWFYGLQRNKTHLVLVNFVRAVAMLINFKTDQPPENVQELLDTWL
jgi:hypothetical protein